MEESLSSKDNEDTIDVSQQEEPSELVPRSGDDASWSSRTLTNLLLLDRFRTDWPMPFCLRRFRFISFRSYSGRAGATDSNPSMRQRAEQKGLLHTQDSCSKGIKNTRENACQIYRLFCQKEVDDTALLTRTSSEEEHGLDRVWNIMVDNFQRVILCRLRIKQFNIHFR